MKKKMMWICVFLLAALLLGGCNMRTVDQMYHLPKRSDQFLDLQSVMDEAMAGMEFCAPVSGENRQTVQMADLDGDGELEYLAFAKSISEKPLRILVFAREDKTFRHVDTIESNGAAFDQVEYIQMDDRPGLELVVGRQVSDQVIRSLSAYAFVQGKATQLVSAGYTRYLTVDLDHDNRQEVFTLCPGIEDGSRGVAMLYDMEKGVVERSLELNLSQPIDCLKRIITGKLHGGQTAVYVASSVEDTALITDVYAIVDGSLTNISISNDSDTSVQTLRNYYVYADDIDNDGVVELPSLIAMKPIKEPTGVERQAVIRWYALSEDGGAVDKLYTYHNFLGGWYLELSEDWFDRIAVHQRGNCHEFYLWDDAFRKAEKVLNVYALSGQNREEFAAQEGYFLLHKAESVSYVACLESEALTQGITQQDVMRWFHMIHTDWKTGET